LQRLIYRVSYRIDYEMSRLSMLEPRQKLSRIVERLRRAETIVRVRIEKTVSPILARYGFRMTHSQAYRLEAIAEAHTRAQRTYTPQPYRGRILLVRAQKQPFGRRPGPALGWGKLLEGDLELQQMPGEHRTVLEEPNVQVLAQLLKASLNKAQNEASQ
jgi:thioesterase domain-containing protein